MRTQLRKPLQYGGVGFLIVAAGVSGWWTSAVLNGGRQSARVSPPPTSTVPRRLPAVQRSPLSPPVESPEPPQFTRDEKTPRGGFDCQARPFPIAIPGLTPIRACGTLY